MGGGVLAGLTALVSPPGPEAEQSESALRDVAQAIDKLRDVIERPQNACFLGSCGSIDNVRVAQHVFLKANQKFPDYIDVGIDVWQAVYDWHIRNRQAITTTRLPDGRYGLAFMFTTLVLRPDNTANYISFGYDAK
jgi:hypothetical protein